jgi:hypothetical protein
VGSRGLWRLAWLGGVLLSCVAMAMTASRGAIVGMVLACVIGGYLYRHLVSYSRVVGWVFASLTVLLVFASFSKYGGLLTERIFGQTSDMDATYASSGRTEIWLNLFATMVHEPITFITGFGWNVYWSFPFRFSPHNHYFALWFNLGLVGLLSGCYLLFNAIGRARRASLLADGDTRRQLIAFVIGATAVCGAVFFVDLHEPWDYFWMYAGVVIRLALCVAPQTAPVPELQRKLRTAERPRDPYGWAEAQGRR